MSHCAIAAIAMPHCATVPLPLHSFYQHSSVGAPRYKLNIWDVGGQKTLRSYWRNYFEVASLFFFITPKPRVE